MTTRRSLPPSCKPRICECCRRKFCWPLLFVKVLVFFDRYSLFERMSENISVDTSDDGNRSRVSMWAVRLCLDMSQKLPKISTSRRQISNQGILVAEWSLMTMLAMAMYYGMILMNAESETMEITLCTITKLSSCFIMLAISDMNNLTRGIFRVRNDSESFICIERQ
jgi:hypothetical protein